MNTLRHAATRLLPIILSLAIMLGPAGAKPAHALDPSTWYVSVTGDDANSCTLPTAPCATIQAAIDKALAGDTIDIAQGIYTGTGAAVVLLNKSLTLSGGWKTDFTLQQSFSVLDAQSSRRGMMISSGVTASIERFEITNAVGQSSGGGGGMLIGDSATVLLTDSLIHNVQSYGGIFSSSANLTVVRTTISDSVDQGILNYLGTLTMKSSSVTGNTYGIVSNGITFIENSTISGNLHGGIAMDCNGTINVFSSTITANHDFGLRTYLCNTATIQNTIIAGNVDIAHPDCTGPLQSNGYNLIGNTTGCSFTASTGDLTNTDAKLGALQDNGGPTQTHALLLDSPAIDAGNPGGCTDRNGTLLATDQRGEPRAYNGNGDGNAVCDIGAYEVQQQLPLISSITRVQADPTRRATVQFTVTFTSPVTGVNIGEESDFALTTAGLTGAQITGLTGSDAAYKVTVSTGTGNGTIRLDLIDNDSILDASSGKPLGGPGTGNGDFSTGQVYNVIKSPLSLSPTGTIWDTTPTFKWSRVPGATQFRYQLMKGTTLVYTKTMLASRCGALTCTNTPTTLLVPGAYKWRVQALIGGVWKPYTAYKSFTLRAPAPGLWKNTTGLLFYVTPDRMKVKYFTLVFRVEGCDYTYKVTKSLVGIKNGQFAFTGAFYANGAFTGTKLSPTTAAGTFGFASIPLPDCGTFTGGPYDWTATWKNSSQPLVPSVEQAEPVIVLPPSDALPEIMELGPLAP